MRRSRLLGIVLTFGLTSGTGCATTAQYMSHWAESADARTKQRAEFRDIEQEARKMALESERAARMAELEKDRECLQRKTEESVRSKLAFNVDQKFDVGQLQVNQDELERLMDRRKKEHEELSKLTQELNDKARREYIQQLKDNLQSQGAPPARAPLVEEEKCGCNQEVCVCARPRRELFRAPERSCQYPEPLMAAKPPKFREPVKQPILPTEIPLYLPIRLGVSMENPTVQDSRIRRLPLETAQDNPRENFRGPCNKCKHDECTCGANHQAGVAAPGRNYANTDDLTPPKPLRDAEPTRDAERQEPVKTEAPEESSSRRQPASSGEREASYTPAGTTPVRTVSRTSGGLQLLK